MTNWLSNLKVGDEVAVRPPWRLTKHGHRHRAIVTNVTQRFICCDALKFRRKDGLEVGGKPNHFTQFYRLEGAWQEVTEREERHQIEKRLRAEFFTLESPGMKRPLDQLRRIVAILDEEKG